MLTIKNCFIAILVLMIPTVSMAGQPHCCTCTQKTIVGTYALASEGTVMMTLQDSTRVPVPIASLSIVTIDRDGAVSSSGYMVIGGEAQWGSQLPGTITVNTDCTGEIAWKNSEGETIMAGELIVHKGGDEISSIMIQGGPLGAPTVTGRWKRISRIPNLQHQGACRSGQVFGTYVAQQSGVNIVPGVGPVPADLLGRVSIHRDGTIDMTGTTMIAGNRMPYTLEDAAWEEGEPACTGTITGSVMAGGTNYMGEMEGWIIVLDHGNELWGIGIEGPGGNPVALGTMKRVSLWPADLE